MEDDPRSAAAQRAKDFSQRIRARNKQISVQKREGACTAGAGLSVCPHAHPTHVGLGCVRARSGRGGRGDHRPGTIETVIHRTCNGPARQRGQARPQGSTAGFGGDSVRYPGRPGRVHPGAVRVPRAHCFHSCCACRKRLHTSFTADGRQVPDGRAGSDAGVAGGAGAASPPSPRHGHAAVIPALVKALRLYPEAATVGTTVADRWQALCVPSRCPLPPNRSCPRCVWCAALAAPRGTRPRVWWRGAATARTSWASGTPCPSRRSRRRRPRTPCRSA